MSTTTVLVVKKLVMAPPTGLVSQFFFLRLLDEASFKNSSLKNPPLNTVKCIQEYIQNHLSTRIPYFVLWQVSYHTGPHSAFFQRPLFRNFWLWRFIFVYGWWDTLLHTYFQSSLKDNSKCNLEQKLDPKKLESWYISQQKKKIFWVPKICWV